MSQAASEAAARSAAAPRPMLSEAQQEALRGRLALHRRVNPFAYEEKLGPWELVKCALGIVLVPVRFLLAVLCMLALAGVCEAAIHCGYNPNKPLGTIRRIIMIPQPYLCRLMMLIFGYYWIDIRGKRAKRAEAPIMVVASHSAFMDSFLLGYLIGPASALSKASVFKTPLFGSVARATQAIPVERGTSDGRKKALDEFVRRAQSDEKWGQLFSFPEGTCTNRKALIQFKKGAFVPGMPIQPILVEWPYVHFDPSWTSGSSRVYLVLRLLTQFYNRCRVTYLPVYTPNEEEKADPELYAENVRQHMARKLGIPTTEHSYEDSFLAMAAHKAKLNTRTLDFQFGDVKLHNLDLQEAKRLLRRFGSDPAVKKSGRMNVKQFARALRVPLSDPVREAFDLLDTDEDGEIDYASFLVGLTFISENATPSDGVDLLFEALADPASHKIDAKRLKKVLADVFRRPDARLVNSLMAAADPNKTGSVDKEAFSAFVQKNPELLVIGLKVADRYQATGNRKVSILSPTEASARSKAARAKTEEAAAAETELATSKGPAVDSDSEDEEDKA